MPPASQGWCVLAAQDGVQLYDEAFTRLCLQSRGASDLHGFAERSAIGRRGDRRDLILELLVEVRGQTAFDERRLGRPDCLQKGIRAT
jgi:hypothetical protein